MLHIFSHKYLFRCKELEARIRVLEVELSEAGASSKSKIAELEGALERTKGDLAGQKSALEEKLSSLEAAVADRNDLEKRLGSTVEEKEANDIRIATLKEELDLMAQDNRWGFSSDVCSRYLFAIRGQ